MPRRPRIISSTGIYHIILRSVNQHIIFEDDSDYQKFLFILSDCKEKYDVDIYAYCLMDNHIHILMNAPPNILSSFFQSLGTRFVRWYNSKYSRSGHLFQDRFHSRAVDSQEYFLTTLVYIHNNPVKALICRIPSDYRWSSYNAYYGEKNQLVNVSFANDIAGSKENLKRFFTAENEAMEGELYSEIRFEGNHFLTDDKAIHVFKLVTQLSSLAEVVNLARPKRDAYITILKNNGLTIKQISRIMDVSSSTVKRICKMSQKTPSPRDHKRSKGGN